MSLLLKSILAASLVLFCFVQQMREEEGQQSKENEIHTMKVHSMLQNAEKMGEKAVYYCPHQSECCGVTPAPGCAHHCRGQGAMSRGPCTQ